MGRLGVQSCHLLVVEWVGRRLVAKLPFRHVASSSHVPTDKGMSMTIDLARLRGLFTVSNIGKLIAIILALTGVPQLTETAPKAMSASGVPVDDLMATLAPFVGAVATWLGASWLKATPELVASAIALMKSPKSDDAAARFEVACLRMLGTRHEGNPRIQEAISQLARALSDARFPPTAFTSEVGRIAAQPAGRPGTPVFIKSQQPSSDDAVVK